ncbi:hypothetical protein BU17DRAFT_53470 [Hysterangium stoloniferum]|nr:hypothetical protein BU17DRAFT_53470 [Hysterangium stoloniferum]
MVSIYFSQRRCVTIIFFTVSSVIICLFTISSTYVGDFVPFPSRTIRRPSVYVASAYGCTPDAFASGRWSRKPDVHPLSDTSQIMNASGFLGCAKKAEEGLQLGLDWDEEHESLLLPWRGNVSAYDWIPGASCEGYNKPEPTDILRQLVEDGGWLLLGDSISDGHFFTISCILYPHVRADPEYPFDRDGKQHLYLSRSSSLITQLKYPSGFDIDKTPLVTFQRVDLLLGKATLKALYLNKSSSASPPELFSEQLVWAPDPAIYLPFFLGTLPYNYQTLILNTAGHWVTSLFMGFANHNESEGYGLAPLLEFFGDAMDILLRNLSDALEDANERDQWLGGRRLKERQVIIRAYNPGHPNCHNAEVLLGGPVDPYPEDNLKGLWNWWWIRKFNDVFKDRVLKLEHPNINFLSLDPIGRSRPDGHVTADCLHVLTGSGVPETWTQYISYFLSRLSR